MQICWWQETSLRGRLLAGRPRLKIPLLWNPSFRETLDQMLFSCRRWCWKVTIYDVYLFWLTVSGYKRFEWPFYYHGWEWFRSALTVAPSCLILVWMFFQHFLSHSVFNLPQLLLFLYNLYNIIMWLTNALIVPVYLQCYCSWFAVNNSVMAVGTGGHLPPPHPLNLCLLGIFLLLWEKCACRKIVQSCIIVETQSSVHSTLLHYRIYSRISRNIYDKILTEKLGGRLICGS